MTTLNSYATLQEYKNWKTARGQSASIDPTDDVVIERLLKTASQFIDGKTIKHFSPYIKTRYFDVPRGSELFLDDDLLEIISITNGDGTSVSSTAYKLLPNNYTPYYSIKLKGSSNVAWEADSNNEIVGVIAVNAVWGFHNLYSQAWTVATTAAEAMDASETGYDVTDGSSFAVGNLIRFDNELGYVSAVATNTLTTTRGANGSTAATHLTAINVSIWQPMEEARNAVCEIANNAYRRRFGESTSSNATVTAAGVVLSPKDIPDMAWEFIKTYGAVV